MAPRNRGKSKSKLRDLSRTGPTYEEREALRSALIKDEAPIPTAILGASIVEHELEIELRAQFHRSNDENWKTLTSDIGPLSTFNQKIIAAYGFGIVDEIFCDALHTVRQIRNAFAHTKRLIDFDNELVVRELKCVSVPQNCTNNLHKGLAAVRAIEDGPRDAFVSLCLIVNMRLLERRIKRSKAKYKRYRARLRRKELANALGLPPELRRAGLLGSLMGYQTVDPTQTIPEEAALSGRDLAPNDSHKTDK